MKYYFLVAVLNSPLEALTYSYHKDIPIGSLINATLKKAQIKGVVLSKVEKPTFETKDIDEILEFYYDSKQLELARFISSYYICSLGESLSIITPFSTISAQSTKSYKECILPKLSSAQQDALKFIKQHQVSLLFGDTGSGKSEIYISYISEILSQGKKAIFLLPEISLTPQMSKRLHSYFGDDILVYHSKLTKKQKNASLERIYKDEVKIVAGPRSALFLPLKNLGVIVVDEEHDDSYKSSSKPYYNARDLAIFIAKVHNANVILGSATPSPSSYAKFAFFRLKGGYFDSKREFIYERGYESVSKLMLLYIQKTLQAKEQVIIFLPTRANFKYLHCQDCSYSFKCVNCSVGMSLYYKKNMLKCHYCNYTLPIPSNCPQCQSTNLLSQRLGTAQVASELRSIFKEYNIALLDRDEITSETKLKKTLDDFNNKKIDILVGTQMLSKGHDYHSIGLAVVLGIDNLLNMADFRASQNALSTLLQVAGRSGRKDDSKVFIQTLNSDFFKKYVDDYELFLQDELKHRQELYPPSKKLARLLFLHKKSATAQLHMEQVLSKLRLFDDIEIVGYGKCLVELVALKYRYEILLRSDKSSSLIRAIGYAKSIYAVVDMDPLEFT